MMKRNMPRGRRPANVGPMNRGPGAPSAPGISLSDRPGATSGPLMTDHLQDLDLELALLKRKREIIEQQQNMLINKPVFNRPNQYDFDEPRQQYGQPSFDEQTANRTRNFSHFYNDGPRTEYNQFERQQGVKRQLQGDWQESGAPKRFGSLPRGKPKRTGNRQAPNPRPLLPEPRRPNPPPRPLMDSVPWHAKPKHVTKPRKDFNPTKVTKPKPVPAPNQLKSYSEAERKQLIGKASDLVAKLPLVLSADEPVSRQVMGRLELALGHILKELKQKYGDDETYIAVFQSFPKQRALKQSIRERIRAVMTGKVVGPMADIMEAYRAAHPMDTDSKLLKFALDFAPPTPPKQAVRPVQTENPEKIIRANFNKLLTQKLDEMFGKLKEVYAADPEISGTVQEIVDKLLDEHQEEATDEMKDSENEGQKNDKGADLSQAADKSEEKANGTIEDTPQENATESQEAAKPQDDKAKDDTKSQDVTQSQESTDNKDEEKDSSKNDDTENVTIDSTAGEDVGNKSKTSAKQLYSARFYTRLIDVLLKRRLPQVLPRYKDNILSVLRLDEPYKTAKASLKAEIRKQAIENGAEPDLNQTNKTETATPQKKPAARVIPYFVKVLGRPSLPKRPLMQAFLDQYHPQTIKKHRGIHNLLFVGFGEKEDFDNILTANQTVIGTSTIDIKVSERTKDNRQKVQEKLDQSDVEMTQAKIEEEKVLDESLDEQLTDLLSSIREQEENKNEEVDIKTEPTNTNINPTDTEKGEPVEDENAGADAEMKSVDTEKPEANPVEDEIAGADAEMKSDDTEKPEANSTEETTKENVDSVEETSKESTKEIKESTEQGKPADNKVEEVKQDAKPPGTPTRSSSRLVASTPRTITTRRTSKLTQNQ